MDRLIEERIRKAMEEGAFNDLPGKGKPLPKPKDVNVPGDLKLSHKVLKNAGFLPPEMELRKEILHLRDLLDCCVKEENRTDLQKTISEKEIQFETIMTRRKLNSPSMAAYKHKIRQRFF
ncbi:DUF1992 domain-containing protein [Aureibacillus halotolerans]|uniref:Uncharacterized protein DUF1992 n=1 Tax=Aureibacillus halotolerans TaxID=1508390 RepID=A0A4R6U5L1_9BACI|nr:DUF1992 domain-containing protein [Aureibacillus halotolerans]TDQ39775.1 uncharacterized protein DUF1992 [Aureibacillus halotolerans]